MQPEDKDKIVVLVTTWLKEHRSHTFLLLVLGHPMVQQPSLLPLPEGAALALTPFCFKVGFVNSRIPRQGFRADTQLDLRSVP